MRFNGRQTIYQMMQLADEVRKRGAEPLEPLAYKDRYHDRLWSAIEHRVAALRDGTLTPELATVPGTHHLLEELSARGLALYLASGTDLKYVREEAALLQVDRFFGPHIYGALDDYQNFSKAMIIEKVLADLQLEGAEVLGFGDGFVEIEEIRKVGGVAVGVASEEETREGVNLWKRNRLVRAGADLIVGDYRRCDDLLQTLGL
jgi:beta-phosphoglucomutase-like phosphatase (HAD superfamily)